jgi:hypothetical protein
MIKVNDQGISGRGGKDWMNSIVCKGVYVKMSMGEKHYNGQVTTRRQTLSSLQDQVPLFWISEPQSTDTLVSRDSGI